MRYREAWDNKASAQSVLVRLEPHANHVFCSLEEALGKSYSALLHQMLPDVSKDEHLSRRRARQIGIA